METLGKQQQDIIRSIEERIVELKSVKQMLIKVQKDYECAVLERDMVRKQNDRLLTSLKDAARIICHNCGKDNGKLHICDGCKWEGVKDWQVD